MRALTSALLAVAAAAVTLGGAGLVVAPHRMPPGTPLVHEHPVTALRFPILVLASAPGIPSADDLAADRARHARHLAWTAADGTVLATFENAHQLALLASGLALASLVFVVARLPRPSRRPVADLLLPAVSPQQWQLRVALPPPRTSVLAVA